MGVRGAYQPKHCLSRRLICRQVRQNLVPERWFTGFAVASMVKRGGIVPLRIKPRLPCGCLPLPISPCLQPEDNRRNFTIDDP